MTERLYRYEVDTDPTALEPGPMIVAFDGFFDAGMAQRLLVDHLLEASEPTVVASFDVDDLIEKFTKPPKTPALDKNKLREEMPELAELAIEVTIEPNIVIRPSKTTVEKIQSKLHVYDADRKEYSDDNPFAH